MSEYERQAARARTHHYVDAYTRNMLDGLADAIDSLVRERDEAVGDARYYIAEQAKARRAVEAERDTLVRERDVLREALIGLEAAYSRAGAPLSMVQRNEDRKRLIAARAALTASAPPSEPKT